MWRKGEIHSVLRVYCNSTENCLLYFRSRHRDQKVQSLGQDDLGFQIQWNSALIPLSGTLSVQFHELKDFVCYWEQSLCLAEDITVLKIFLRKSKR